MFPNPIYKHGYGGAYWGTDFVGYAVDYILIDTTRQDPIMNACLQEEAFNYVQAEYERVFEKRRTDAA